MKISDGVKYNFKAISLLLKNPKLWPYCIIPFMLSVLIMIFTIYFAFSYFYGYVSNENENGADIKIEGVSTFFQYIWSWMVLNIGVWLKWIFFVLAILVFVWYGYAIIASIVMLPFLELLSCRVEEKLRGISSPDNAWYVGLISSLMFSLSFTVLKIMFMLIFLILGLMFPPIIVLSFIVMAWFCSMEALDLSMSRRLFKFHEKLHFFKGRHKMMVGVGSFSSGLLLVPLIQVFQPILSAIAGTIYWVDETPEYGPAIENNKN